jgi:hypothetical protein
MTSRFRTRVPLLGVLFLALVACGIGPDAPTDDRNPGGGPRAEEPTITVAQGQADGPGISVEDAIAGARAEAVLVNGALFIDADGVVRLCSAVAESFPPQCAGERLRVIGLDPASLPDLKEASGVRWAEQAQVYGVVSGTE